MPQHFSISKKEVFDTPYLKVELLDNSKPQLQAIKQLLEEKSHCVRRCNITHNRQDDLTIYIKTLFTTDEAFDEVENILNSHFGNGVLRNDTINYTDGVLNELVSHPKPLELYKKAIDGFQKQQDYRHAMDDLRLSLELLLKDVLSNEKSLEKQDKFLNAHLGRGGISTEIIAGITEEMKALGSYFNEHEKHKDDIKINEIDCVVDWVSHIMHVVMSVKPVK